MQFALYDLLKYSLKVGEYSHAALEAAGLWPATRANAIANGLSSLQVGDLILYHHAYSVRSWAIMYWTNGPMSHMATYCGDGEVFDGTTAGVVEHPIADYFDGQGYLSFRHLDLTTDQRRKMRRSMQTMLGNGFNWRGVIRFWLSIIFGADKDYRVKFSVDILIALGALLVLTSDVLVLFLEVVFVASIYTLIVVVNQIRMKRQKQTGRVSGIPSPSSAPSTRSS